MNPPSMIFLPPISNLPHPPPGTSLKLKGGKGRGRGGGGRRGGRFPRKEKGDCEIKKKQRKEE